MDKDEFLKGLDRLQGRNLRGYMVMVLDPQEINFDFKGITQFNGMEGEGSQVLPKAEAMQQQYREKMMERIRWVEKQCRRKGFEFILQRSDQPLNSGLLALYGRAPNIAPGSLAPGMNNKP